MQANPSGAHPHVVLFTQHLLLAVGQLGHEAELHVQLPFSQTRWFMQTLPHAPQLELSCCSFTHAPLHELKPARQV
jgi:hypothetical protein